MEIRDFYNDINKKFDDAYLKLKEVLKSHDGFICTDDDKKDYLYGFDFIDDKTTERRILAIRLDNDDVEVYCVPLTSEIGYFVEIENWDAHTNDDWDTFYEGESEGYWISLWGSEMYAIFTLYNILEVIEEYL